MSVSDFSRTFFTVKMVSPYFVEYAQKWRTDRGADLKEAPDTQTTINILFNARPGLIDALLPFIESEQHQSLKDLINNQSKPAEPIICQCEQVIIGRIFYPLIQAKDKTNRQIQDDKTKIAKWICEYFRYRDSGLIKEFSYQKILKYLTTKRFHEQQ